MAIEVDDTVTPPSPTVTSVSLGGIAWDAFPDAVGFEPSLVGTDPPATLKVTVSSDWLDGASSYSVPDPADVPGWPADLVPGSPANWLFRAYVPVGDTASMLEIQNAFAIATRAPDGLHVVITAASGSLPP